ncbi:hypothetical protein BV25DRAFT_1830384 [Artomyces pyxidatus]|uniref:Uncharacterized protein n=1 Tax=Artomyces pyxidatus TaxID=48021 RepID=A0ACB8SNY3_9AGAM|nr:hypothetical protein BV25DRAFT_1830384 [Artomyces pyxidatus]
MGRVALFTDVLVGGAGPRARVLRVANTHLESMPEGARSRRAQLAAVADYLNDEGVVGGLVAGDMNSISEGDGRMVREFGLSDAWRYREEADPIGATWGFQPPGDLPQGRLDKVLYVRRREYRIRRIGRIGVGLCLEDGQYVSDHVGLMCQINMVPEE